MAVLGSLDLVLTGNASQLRRELQSVRNEAQSAAGFMSGLFNNDALNAAGFRVLSSTITGTIRDLDDLNSNLTVTQSLLKNLKESTNELGEIAILQAGQYAQFLGEDLFNNPLAELQSASLERSGLGQLQGTFTLISAGANAAKILDVAINGVSSGFTVLDGILGSFQTKIQNVSNFFQVIADGARIGSTVLVSAVKAIDQAIEDLIISLSEVNPYVNFLRKAANQLGIEFSLGRAIFGDYIDDLDKLERNAQGIANASQKIADGTGTARDGINSANDSINNFGRSLNRQREAALQFETGIKELADAAILFDSWKQVSDFFDPVLGSLEQTFQAASKFEGVESRLQLTSSAAGGAAEDLQFLADTVDNLGLADANFETTEAFTQLQAAAKGTALEGEQTKEIFEGVAQAASVMRLSADQTSGVLLALQQIISKGTVQAEELRGQLGERLPGAFQVAARAMGVTTQELDKLLQSGEITADEFLPKFAAQLKLETASGLADSADSAQAAMNRLNNAIANFQTVSGQAWVDVGVPAINALTKALEIAAEKEEYVSTVIDSVLVAAIGRGVFALGAFAKALITGTGVVSLFGGRVSVTGGVVKLFGRQIGEAVKTFGAYAAQAALAYAATILFYRNLERATDAGKEYRKELEGLDKTLADLNSTSENTDLNVIPEKAPPLDFIDAIAIRFNDLTDEADTAGERIKGSFLQIGGGGLLQLGSVLNRSVNFFRTGSFEFVSAAEAATSQIIVAVGDLNQRAQEVLGQSLDFRANEAQGVVNEIAAINNELNNVQQRKLSVDPNDTEAVGAILAEENSLLERRAELQGKIQNNEAAINAALETQKQALQNLPATQEYEGSRSQIEAIITLLEKEKAALGDLGQVAQSAAVQTTQAFTEKYQQLDIALVNQQAAIEEAVTAGNLTEAQGQQKSLEAQRQYLADKLKAQQDNLAQLKADLAEDTQLRAADPQAAGLLTPEQISQYQQQVLQLETDTANNRIELAQTVREGQKQANEDALADLESANRAAEAEIQQSQNSQILAVKKLQLGRQISAEEAENRIAAIEKRGIQERLTENASAIEKINALKASGQISEEEAIAKLSELEQQRSELNLQAVDAEIAAQQRLAEAKFKAQEDALRTSGEVQSGRLDIQSGALDSESGLLNAQNELLTAQSNLRQQNLQGAIALATAEGNTNEVFRLRKELASEQRNLLASQQEIQRRQLEITQQQRDLDLERQRINAEIAVAEAEIAIQKAEVEGTTAEEVANLEKILGLRKEQLAAVGAAIDSNEELKDLEDAALEANQALEKSKASQAESMQSQVDSAKELQEIQNSIQNTQNQSAVDAAQAAYDDNPSVRNLKALQDARQKALDDEFAQRQKALDAENKFAIDNATEQANAAGEAYQEALGKFNQAGLDARADGTVTDEEQKKLDLMQEQTGEAEKQAKLANQEVANQRNLAKARQDQLSAERKAANEAEQRKRDQEIKEARAKGLLSGVQGADISKLGAARKALQQITEDVAKFGKGKQFQSLLQFSQQDSRFKGEAGQFNDVLLAKLGGTLGNTTLQLEKIADAGKVSVANQLAKQLDQAQVSGNSELFNKLVEKISQLAASASTPKTINITGATGEAGQIIRELQRSESGARM